MPKLVHFDEAHAVIEMSIVTPPFILDFAAATVDYSPDFTEEAMDIWWDEVRESFGEDFDVARDVFHGLKRRHGIHYWDMKPRNLRVR